MRLEGVPDITGILTLHIPAEDQEIIKRLIDAFPDPSVSVDIDSSTLKISRDNISYSCSLEIRIMEY